MACAWMYEAIIKCKAYQETTKGCGMAVTLCKVTVVKFEQAKVLADKLGPTYKQTFDKIYGTAVAMRDKTVSENAKIYYDSEAKLD